MSILSIPFWMFFVAVYLVYLTLRWRWQNRLLLAASLVFYGAYSWKYLPLLLFSVAVSFCSGILIDRASNARAKKLYLWAAVGLELGMLLFFKLVPAGSGFLLPLGISYYTFQAISYTVDVYWERIRPTRSLLNFALFKSFFPIVSSGPIERAENLLAQIEKPRSPDARSFEVGVYLIAWGLFKKLFVANGVAPFVDQVFGSYPSASGLESLLAVYAAAFQIYCDFSGYTDIARGMGRLLGFDLALNFKLPFFSRNPADYWRRCHISLAQWMRDYVYFPLLTRTRLLYLAVFVSFFLNGVWHGLSTHFVLLGAYYGLLVSAYAFVRPFSVRVLSPKGDRGKAIVTLLSITATFQFICVGYLLFRGESLPQIAGVFHNVLHGAYVPTGLAWYGMESLALHCAPLLALEAFQYRFEDETVFLRADRRLQYACALCAAIALGAAVVLGSGRLGSGEGFLYLEF